LSFTSGFVSPQFQVVFDELFETVYCDGETLTSELWVDLLRTKKDCYLDKEDLEEDDYPDYLQEDFWTDDEFNHHDQARMAPIVAPTLPNVLPAVPAPPIVIEDDHGDATFGGDNDKAPVDPPPDETVNSGGALHGPEQGQQQQQEEDPDEGPANPDDDTVVQGNLPAVANRSWAPMQVVVPPTVRRSETTTAARPRSDDLPRAARCIGRRTFEY